MALNHYCLYLRGPFRKESQLENQFNLSAHLHFQCPVIYRPKTVIRVSCWSIWAVLVLQEVFHGGSRLWNRNHGQYNRVNSVWFSCLISSVFSETDGDCPIGCSILPHDRGLQLFLMCGLFYSQFSSGYTKNNSRACFRNAAGSTGRSSRSITLSPKLYGLLIARSRDYWWLLCSVHLTWILCVGKAEWNWFQMRGFCCGTDQDSGFVLYEWKSSCSALLKQ